MVARLHAGARTGGSPGLKPRDDRFEERVRASFARQAFMATIGARIAHIAPGEVDVELPITEAIGQQNGFVHAGVVAGATDSACGYATATLLEEGTDVLTAEFKINLLEPARGERLVARGRVLRAGRTLTVCRGEAFAVSAGEDRLVATMLATMVAVRRT